MNPTTKPTGYVYVIHAIGTNRIKIGHTTDLKGRLRGLQTAAPYPLQMLANWPGTKARERRVHRYLNQFRKVGEWFEVPPFTVGYQIWQLVTKGDVTGEVKDQYATGKLSVKQSTCQRSTKTTRRYNKTGRPCVEATKCSPGSWYIRLRWNQKPGRPVTYCCTLTNKEYAKIKRNRWAQYKAEILEKYAPLAD